MLVFCMFLPLFPRHFCGGNRIYWPNFTHTLKGVRTIAFITTCAMRLSLNLQHERETWRGNEGGGGDGWIGEENLALFR